MIPLRGEIIPWAKPKEVFAWAVSSRPPHINRQVLVLEEPVRLPQGGPLLEWRFWGKRYVIHLGLWDNPSITKMLRITKSKNLGIFQRVGHALIPIQTLDGKWGTLRWLHRNPTMPHSQPHLNLFMHKPAYLTWRLVRIS